jgi:hypothetical protein
MSAPQCPSVIRFADDYDPNCYKEFRCWRSAGHDGEHCQSARDQGGTLVVMHWNDKPEEQE